mgnify:FL=1
MNNNSRIELKSPAHLIIDKEAQVAETVLFAGQTLVVAGKDGKPLNKGAISLSAVYVALFCDKVKNLTFLKEDGEVFMLIFSDEEDYRKVMAAARSHGKSVRFSSQNHKIAQYAGKISGKLADGVKISVVDAVDESKVKYCPECGMQVEPGQQYCFECGAELPQ